MDFLYGEKSQGVDVSEAKRVERGVVGGRRKDGRGGTDRAFAVVFFGFLVGHCSFFGFVGNKYK